MPIQKLILICIIFAATLLGSVLAADKPTAQVDIDKLQEQVRTLDKELAIQREAFVRKLDDVEKRQIEITAQQANSLAAIANQTTALGNYIAYTSAAITVIVFIAGIATYFSAKSKAEKEARVASAKWFEENAVELKNQIEALRAEAANAASQIKTQVQQVLSTAAVANQSIEASVANTILSASKMSPTDERTQPADLEAAQVVSKASQSLESKPESEFTANDFFTRGLAHYSNQDFHAALSAFESALKLKVENSTPYQFAQYLFAKSAALNQLDKPQDVIAVLDELDRYFGADTIPAVRKLVAAGLRIKGMTLGNLDKSQDEIAVYDELDRRFGADTAPAVCEQVARGLVSKGFRLGQMDKPQDAIAVYDELDRRFGTGTNSAVSAQVAKGLNSSGFQRILLAKQMWQHAATRNEHLNVAARGLKRAYAQCGENDRAMILGNLGYSLFLTGQSHAAEEPTLECLRLGGQKALEAQRADAKLHRVEPEDSQYEELLTRLWQSLPPITGGS